MFFAYSYVKKSAFNYQDKKKPGILKWKGTSKLELRAN